MKILIVSQYFWPENFRINDLATGLADEGHDVDVITGIPNYPVGGFFKGYSIFGPKFEFYKKIKVYRSLLFPRGSGGKIKLFLNYLSFAFFASIRILLLSKKEYDIIFVHEPSPITVGIPALIFKKIKKIPIVFWVMDLWPESIYVGSGLKSKTIDKLILPLVKLIYRESDKILVTSRAFISSIIEKNINPKKISYFPQYAEAIFYQANINSQKYQNLFPDGFNILFAGNIGEAQDFNSIIKAAELSKDKKINWIIIGSGRNENWVKNQIKEKKLENTIYLLGKYPLEAMPNMYSCADALLITLKKSKILSLTAPGKIQSCLAFGKPILTMMDGEGSRIILESKAGLTACSGDSKTLIKNALKMKGMQMNELKKMGDNGRKYYEINFERKFLINRLINIFLTAKNIKS